MTDSKPSSKSLFYFILATVFLTWLLILIGGVVHGTGSSLACPDWPTCYGTFFPEMKGAIFFEHGHRVVASLVGFLTIILVFWCWKRGRRLRYLSLSCFFLVVFQGVLGGITVIYRLPAAISTAHLASSMAFLACLIALAVQAWVQIDYHGDSSPQIYPGLRKWILPSLLALYLQLIFGALVRHLDAGLACTEIPLCQGSLWIMNAPWVLKIHLMHRLLGYSIFGFLLLTTFKILTQAPHWRLGKILVFCAIGLLLVQIGLGLWSVYSALELIPVTAHLGVAALLWANVALLFLMSGYIHLPQSSYFEPMSTSKAVPYSPTL